MAGTIVSPGGCSQISKRNALYKSRGTSPTFRDVLRDRCHLRIKARRGSLLEQFRDMKSNVELRTTLSNMLHEEVEDLKSETVKIMEVEDYQPIIDVNREHQDDEDKWIIEEYEKVLAEEEALYNFEWDNEVICPLCEKAVLRLSDNGSIKCKKCIAEFPKVPSLMYFRDNITSVLTTHQEECDDIAQFALIPDGSIVCLFLLCHTCGFFLQTV
uniref:RPA-interacting protein C-terminal domain-containing protein n=1 Tax=Panstrongylus lignarius TaxID=156445 RepID=A0A224XP19_9HEMI